MNRATLEALQAIDAEVEALTRRTFALYHKVPEADLTRPERSWLVLLHRRLPDAGAYAQRILRQAGGQTEEIAARLEAMRARTARGEQVQAFRSRPDTGE